MEGKRYRLLQPLPDGSKIGDEYKLVDNKYHNERMWNEAQGIDESVRWETWQVENNSSWFELIPKSIKVTIWSSHERNQYGENYHYAVPLGYKIPNEKFPAIQSAIENVLNGTVLKDWKEWSFVGSHPLGIRVDIDTLEQEAQKEFIAHIVMLKNEAVKQQKFSMASNWREVEKMLTEKLNQKPE